MLVNIKDLIIVPRHRHCCYCYYYYQPALVDKKYKDLKKVNKPFKRPTKCIYLLLLLLLLNDYRRRRGEQ